MPKMVIEVPEEFTEVGKAMAEHLAALQRTVSRLGGGKAVDYGEIEQAMAESAGRTELAGHRAILQSLDIDVAAVMIGGMRYTRVGRCEAPYHTMVGSVSVERSLYRQSGERGGQPGGRVVDPVSLRAGVVEDGWLPRTARAMAHAVQQGPSREAEASAREFGRLPYSRSSFERVAHLVGALAVADHQDIEDALIDAVEVPEEARSISVSLDGVSVPMEEPRRRPAGRPKKGAPKKPVERNFRMAYCGYGDAERRRWGGAAHDSLWMHARWRCHRITRPPGCRCRDAAQQAAGFEAGATLRRGSGDVESVGGGIHSQVR